MADAPKRPNWVGATGKPGARPMAPPEDRHYRNQIGIGDRGALSRFHKGRAEDESTAEEYLMSTKKPYKKKSVIAAGLREHLESAE